MKSAQQWTKEWLEFTPKVSVVEEAYIKAIKNIQLDAFIEGISTYAWWKDGIQYVGTSGKTLKKAIEEAKTELDKS